MTDSTLGFGKKIIWKREEEDLHFDLPVPENIISVK
jgi:hypothetical protein